MPSFEVKANQVFAKPHKNFFSSQMSFSKNAVHQKTFNTEFAQLY